MSRFQSTVSIATELEKLSRLPQTATIMVALSVSYLCVTLPKRATPETSAHLHPSSDTFYRSVAVGTEFVRLRQRTATRLSLIFHEMRVKTYPSERIKKKCARDRCQSECFPDVGSLELEAAHRRCLNAACCVFNIDLYLGGGGEGSVSHFPHPKNVPNCSSKVEPGTGTAKRLIFAEAPQKIERENINRLFRGS